jgi:hypothetical protein
MPVFLKIGGGVIDVLDPKPEHVDLDAIERNLWTAKRFSNNPDALVVRQHTHLVALLAKRQKEHPFVIRWCGHHDDHKGVIGDIPGPLKSWINTRMGHFTLDDVEAMLDRAICHRNMFPYPDKELRDRVHFYDKLAETLEWRFMLGHGPEPWNKPFLNWISEAEARRMVEDVAKLLPPPRLFV